ncbi:DUF6364 family protein [Flavobacterium album]|uniref:DUF6364 family protein n=1 Tax=Flavobacterium album TaxID=2175091 RepID=UPI0015E7E6B6|nr:DUF6364 family protein [Flavobacterium album]
MIRFKFLGAFLSSFSYKRKNKITPLVESLTGAVNPIQDDYRKDYTEYLSKKYL